jgi:hypothetical protein
MRSSLVGTTTPRYYPQMAPIAATPTQPSLISIQTLETLGKLATVVGVLLPVTGAVSRELAFLLSGRIPLGIGSTLPIAQLAAYGAVVMLPGVVFGLAIAWLVRRPFRISWFLPKVRGLSKPRAAFLWALYLAMTALVLWLFANAASAFIAASSKSISGLLGSVVAVGVILWSSRLPREIETVPFARLIPVVLMVAAATAVGASIGPTTAGTSLMGVAFTPNAGLVGGSYSLLGESDDSLWLLSCVSNAMPVRVRSSEVVTMTVEPFGPSVPLRTTEESATRGLGPGFVQRCP